MLINPEANSDYYFQHITAREGEQERRDRGRGGKTRRSKTQREPHGAHNHLHGGVPENMRYRKSESGEGWRVSGCFFFFFRCIKSLQSLQAWLSIPNLDGCYNTVHYSDINWSGEISRECDYDVGCHGVVYKSNRKLLLLRVAFPRLASPASEVSPRNQLIPTQVVPALPHLTSLLKTDQQYNLITAALQRETSVNTSPFYLLIHLDK